MTRFAEGAAGLDFFLALRRQALMDCSVVEYFSTADGTPC